MASQRTHTRPLFLIVLTALLMMSVLAGSIQAQDGLIPLPLIGSRDITELQVIEPPAGYLTFARAMAADGDVLLVSAQQNDSIETEVVLAYHRSGSGLWVHEATLIPDDYEQFDEFGSDIAISGNMALISSPGAEYIGDDADDDAEGEQNEGVAYFFERDASGNWTQGAQIHGSTRGNDNFGTAIAFEGNHAAGVENPGIGGEGSATAFVRGSSGDWINDGHYYPGNGLTSTSDVMVNSNYLVVVGSNYNSPTDSFGSTVIFKRSGGNWQSPPTYLTSEGDMGSSAVELYGNQLFLAHSGSLIVAEEIGGTWAEVQRLLPDASDPAFGDSVDVDGTLLAVSDWIWNTNPASNAVYLFSWNGTEWVRLDKTVSSALNFGQSVVLSDQTLFVISGHSSNDSLGKIHIYAVDAAPPVTPEPTSEPTQEPTSDPTAEPTQEPTSDPTDEPTPVPPTSTPETTPDPTSDPTDEPDTQVLADGGFEQQLTGWTLKKASGDKLKCNKPEKNKFFSHTGECAFMFKGGAGENSKIQQTITSGVNPGSMLTLSGFVNAKGAVSSKVKVVVKYADGVTPKSKIMVNVNSTTGGVYVPLSHFQPVLTTSVAAPIEKIKVVVKNKGESGKVYYDALSLIAQ